MNIHFSWMSPPFPTWTSWCNWSAVKDWRVVLPTIQSEHPSSIAPTHVCRSLFPWQETRISLNCGSWQTNLLSSFIQSLCLCSLDHTSCFIGMLLCSGVFGSDNSLKVLAISSFYSVKGNKTHLTPLLRSSDILTNRTSKSTALKISILKPKSWRFGSNDFASQFRAMFSFHINFHRCSRIGSWNVGVRRWPAINFKAW